MLHRAKLVDAGIDYLRVTSADRERQKQMFEYFRNIAALDEHEGYAVKPGGVFGFAGRKSRHALWGVKADWALVQSTGRFAKRGLQLALSGIQASRIDLQMTFRVSEGAVPSEIRDAYEEACDHKGVMGRPRAVKMIEERHQPQTVYIGRRASDVFVRIYDKFEESGKEEFRDCIRFEVELKGRAAKQLWQRMTSESLGIGFLMQLLKHILLERGIILPVDAFAVYPEMTFKKEPSSVEAKLAWMSRQVAPTVKKLVAEFGFITPFRVLFEQALTDFRTHRIMRMLSIVSGN
jgi:hypothetical protein